MHISWSDDLDIFNIGNYNSYLATLSTHSLKSYKVLVFALRDIPSHHGCR